ncbi:MAG: pyridoxal-dependent decarboxylase [Pseudomonadota bacterium]
MSLPKTLPPEGIGEAAALALVGELITTRSADLGAPHALAHMDPPPPAIAASLVGQSAGVNQNLLHPDLSPFASEAEARVIAWLAPPFGMAAGHLCAGSSIANLTGLWAAREHGATRVVASADAHLSIAKAAHILGLPLISCPVDNAGRLDVAALPGLSGAALVLTAGTTGRGAIDPLARQGALWCHVDAAWAGPLRLTAHAPRVAGLEAADSLAVSAHKWLFQPKDSALVLFRDPAAQKSVSFGGAYLAVPNLGVQGSRSAAGVALLGTLLAWGTAGLAARIERCVHLIEALAERLAADPRARLTTNPQSAVLTWTPRDGDTEALIRQLGATASRTAIAGEAQVRHVAANPAADLEAVWARIDAALTPPRATRPGAAPRSSH